MECILEELRWKMTRDSTAGNYYSIWKKFNMFVLQLDKMPKMWEQHVPLYGAFLVNRGIQSSTIRSYFSAIKKILTDVGYNYKQEEVMLNTLTKACRIINDKICTCLPINIKLLEILLFEIGHIFKSQFYLESLYKTIFCLAYYGLFRIGELTHSPHAVKACNINIGQNKNKLLIILYSSKTHGKESRPQQVKISEIKFSGNKYKSGEQRHFFCLFKLTWKYLTLRGNYVSEEEQFFIFHDRSPVYPAHVRDVLRTALKRIGLNSRAYNCQSFRIGRCSDLIKLGYSVDSVKLFGRWKLNAVYKYIRS